MVHVRRLHERYGGRAQFFFVYISEAPHELPDELRPFAEPAGAAPGSRLRLLPRVRAGIEHFNLRFPCLLDNEQAEVEKLYDGFPTRLIIVGSAGRIALDSGFMSSDAFPWKRISDWFERHDTSPSPRAAEQS